MQHSKDLMRIDAQRIKSEREKRAWTQEHLAKVSGLGHRTVQRIETTGVASFESVMALATTLELDTKEIVQPVPETQSVSTVRVSLLLRLVLAVFAAFLVQSILGMDIDLNDGWLAEQLWLIFLGSLFGVAILVPMLKAEPGLQWRMAAAVGLSGLSFCCAYWTAIYLLEFGELVAFITASVVGLALVLLAAVVCGIVKASGRVLIIAGIVALASGVLFDLGFYRVSDFEYSEMGTLFAFCSWHCLATVFLNSQRMNGGKDGKGDTLLESGIRSVQRMSFQLRTLLRQRSYLAAASN